MFIRPTLLEVDMTPWQWNEIQLLHACPSVTSSIRSIRHTHRTSTKPWQQISSWIPSQCASQCFSWQLLYLSILIYLDISCFGCFFFRVLIFCVSGERHGKTKFHPESMPGHIYIDFSFSKFREGSTSVQVVHPILTLQDLIQLGKL